VDDYEAQFVAFPPQIGGRAVSFAGFTLRSKLVAGSA